MASLTEIQLKSVANLVEGAMTRRDAVIVNTADKISRRKAAKLVGLSPGRVQQIIDKAHQKTPPPPKQ